MILDINQIFQILRQLNIIWNSRRYLLCLFFSIPGKNLVILNEMFLNFILKLHHWNIWVLLSQLIWNVLNLLLLVEIILLLVIIYVLLIKHIIIDFSFSFELNALILKLKILKINNVFLSNHIVLIHYVHILRHLLLLLSQHLELIFKLNLWLEKLVILVKILWNVISFSRDC